MRRMVVVGLVLAAMVLVVGYAGLVFVGAVATPPGAPRTNEGFSTISWSQTGYGSSARFRTITVELDGSYTETFADPAHPDHQGTLTPDALARLRAAATDRALAAEARWTRYAGGPDCTDSATITITMGELRVSALDCGEATAAALPAFDRLSGEFFAMASNVQPPGGA